MYIVYFYTDILYQTSNTNSFDPNLTSLILFLQTSPILKVVNHINRIVLNRILFILLSLDAVVLFYTRFTTVNTSDQCNTPMQNIIITRHPKEFYYQKRNISSIYLTDNQDMSVEYKCDIYTLISYDIFWRLNWYYTIFIIYN